MTTTQQFEMSKTDEIVTGIIAGILFVILLVIIILSIGLPFLRNKAVPAPVTPEVGNITTY